MHGIAFPTGMAGRAGAEGGLSARLWAMARANRVFLLMVVLPTLLVATYYYLIASDQYESSADFVVRHAENAESSSSVGQLLGFSLGTSASSAEAYVVQEFLLSHDAVSRLRAEDDLVNVFRRDGSDWISRLWFSHPSPERLLKYYRQHVTITQDETSGITHLSVQTFRPEDSRQIASKLLQMGEAQINVINQRTYVDQLASAKRDLDEADRQLIDIQTRLTAYRRGQEDIDPADTGRARVMLVTGLTSNLVAARANFQAMSRSISHTSPQYLAMKRQVDSLEAQVAGQSAQIAGSDSSVATRLSDYEQLVIKREEVAKVYAAAAGQYAQAQAEVKRKQLYLIRVVEPNLPVKSEFPKRGQIVLTTFAALFFAYAIGWLLWAGVKEHSM